MRKPCHLTGRLVLVLAVALMLVALVACDSDDDSDMVEQPPAAETESARRAEPTVAPEPTPTPAPPAEPTAPPGLAAECLPGGGIEDVATITSCAEQALRQAPGFSFEGEFNLFALFSGFVPEGQGPPAGEGLMQLSGAIVPPDRMQVEITFGPQGEAVQVAVIVIGQDTYFRDPGTNFWFKGRLPIRTSSRRCRWLACSSCPGIPAGRWRSPWSSTTGPPAT